MLERCLHGETGQTIRLSAKLWVPDQSNFVSGDTIECSFLTEEQPRAFPLDLALAITGLIPLVFGPMLLLRALQTD